MTRFTEEQTDALVSAIEAIARHEAARLDDSDRFYAYADRACDAVDSLRAVLQEEPDPVPVEELCSWRVVAAPHKCYGHAIQDQHGSYWTFPDGSIWHTGQRRTAAKKARELNAL